MELVFIAFLIAFGAAAWHDAKTKNVPDIYLALAWLAIALPPFNHALLAIAFALVFFSNTILAWLGKPIGWADVLALPVFLTFISIFPVAISSIAALACLPFLFINTGKKQVAFLPFLFATALSSWILAGI